MLLAKKYSEIIDKQVEGEAADELWKQCEKIEKQLGDDPINILYSDNSDEIVSYRQKVMEMESDKDDFLYSMAGHKGETIETLGTKSVSDLFSFAERFNNELNGRH